MLAQLVEQPPCKRQVVGAEPTHGSIFYDLWMLIWRGVVLKVRAERAGLMVVRMAVGRVDLAADAVGLVVDLLARAASRLERERRAVAAFLSAASAS